MFMNKPFYHLQWWKTWSLVLLFFKMEVEMFCISSIGSMTLSPFKLTNQPVLGCCYFSDRRQESPDSETGRLNAHNRSTVRVTDLPSVKVPSLEACTHSKLGDGRGMWNLGSPCLCSKSTLWGTCHLFPLSPELLIAKSAQGSELHRAVKIWIGRNLEVCPHSWLTASRHR